MVFCNSNDAEKLWDRISYIYIDDVNARFFHILSLSNSGKGLKIQGKARLIIDPHKLKTSWQLGVDSSTFGALHRSRRGQGSNFPLGLNI